MFTSVCWLKNEYTVFQAFQNADNLLKETAVYEGCFLVLQKSLLVTKFKPSKVKLAFKSRYAPHNANLFLVISVNIL